MPVYVSAFVSMSLSVWALFVRVLFSGLFQRKPAENHYLVGAPLLLIVTAPVSRQSGRINPCEYWLALATYQLARNGSQGSPYFLLKHVYP